MDYIIKNVKIIDGSGRPAGYGDVGVIGGKIRLHDLPQSIETRDGTGLTLTPGFIDSHAHSDLCIGADPAVAFLCKISQGVTTEINGQCGISLFPTPQDHASDVLDCIGAHVSPRNTARMSDFNSFSDFERIAGTSPMAVNGAYLVGHNTLRAAVMGSANRSASRCEMEAMKALLREAMEQGAAGLSSGLVYIPGAYADSDELIELCSVIAPFGGVYATHMRNEAEMCPDSVAESIAVAEKAGVRLVISHHKICGRRNWGLSKKTLSFIDDATARGAEVYLDVYPYHATMTTLDNCLPPDVFASGHAHVAGIVNDRSARGDLIRRIESPDCGYDNPYQNAGGFDGILISFAANTKEAQGKTIAQWADIKGMDPFDAYFDLLLKNDFRIMASYFSLNEDEMIDIYLHPRAVVGSDAICSETPGPTHPRAYGSFIKPLADFALRRHIISLEQAVRKQTSLTADIWGIKNRGLIADGYDADLVLIDERALLDRASFQNGAQLCEGIKAVIVNGETVYDGHSVIKTTGGRVLKRKGGILY